MHEIQRTSTFTRQYQQLALRFRRMVDEAMDIVKEYPVEYQSKITKISNHKDGVMYRFRMPGCYMMYVVPPFEEGESVIITLLDIKHLTKQQR
jgi:hypothetical protein